MESWTYGGHNRELDFGGPVACSCDKVGNTIVYYTTHCPCDMDLLLVIW